MPENSTETTRQVEAGDSPGVKQKLTRMPTRTSTLDGALIRAPASTVGDVTLIGADDECNSHELLTTSVMAR